MTTNKELEVGRCYICGQFLGGEEKEALVHGSCQEEADREEFESRLP